jgi:uncharacterized protein YijF (DUF1287 family)
VKKSAKSRKSGGKSGSRNAKPQPQAAGRTTNVQKLDPVSTLAAVTTAAPTDAIAWLNSLRPPTAVEQTVVYRLPPAPRYATTSAVGAARTANTYDTEDRGTIFLMMVPFLVIALSLGISQTVRPFITSLPPVPSGMARAPTLTPAPPIMIAQPPVIAPADPATLAAQRLAAQRLAAWTPPALPWPRDDAPPRIDVPTVPVATAPLPRPMPIYPPLIIAPPALTLPDGPPLIAGPPITRPITPDGSQVCERAPPLVLPVMGRSTVPPQAVGAALAGAAVEQTKDFVVYSAKYQRLGFPIGDLPSLYGSCSDVIVRAYRTIGLDLQELVQRMRAGRGDSNIDHRRTEMLRKFFTQYGESLIPTAFPEDYQPGDIVTYYRPFSRVSRAHIAVVSDIRAPTGRLMIVHNRGWGPQLEDALFVDKITGHYRFDGTKLPPIQTTATASAAKAVVSAVPLALRPQPQKPGQMSRVPMMTPTSAVMEPTH